MFIRSFVAVVVDEHNDETNIGHKISIIAHLSVTIKFLCTPKTVYVFMNIFENIHCHLGLRQ